MTVPLVPTGSNMEPLLGRMDFNLTEVPVGFKADLERVVNEEIARDRAIVDRVVTREEAMADPRRHANRARPDPAGGR